MYVDTEYLTLESLNENNALSQRQLSKILGISLGSVNMMLAKMQRDGFIKIKNISPGRVIYMLTPEGIAEKADKTLKYIARNYKYINDTKEKIKVYLERTFEMESSVYLAAGDSEISKMVIGAAEEIGMADKLKIIKDKSGIMASGLVILTNNNDKAVYDGLRTEMVLERI